MDLEFKIGQDQIIVSVDGLNTSCQTLAQQLESKLKTKFFRITYLARKSREIVQMNKNIGCYIDLESTSSLEIIKYVPIWIYIDKNLKLQKEFEYSDKIETVLKQVQNTGENLMNRKILLSSNTRNKIKLNQQNYLQQTLNEFEKEAMPLHMYIFQEDQNLIGYSQVLEEISTSTDQSTQVSESDIEIALKDDLISSFERSALWLDNNSKEVENFVRELQNKFKQELCLKNELHNKIQQNEQFQEMRPGNQQNEQRLLTSRRYKSQVQINKENEEICNHYQSLVNFVKDQQDEINKFYQFANDKLKELKEQSEKICSQIDELKSQQVNSLYNNLSEEQNCQSCFQRLQKTSGIILINISLDQLFCSTQIYNQISNNIKKFCHRFKQEKEKSSKKQQQKSFSQQ